MTELDGENLLEHSAMIGLITREQAHEARCDAEDGSWESIVRTVVRKGFLTSWQVEKLLKSEHSGFFFGDCKILFHIAEGTFARVYRGVRQKDGKPVAVKVLRQRFVSDPGAIERFNKEAEAGLRLKHLNIVRIYDYGEEDKRHYMTMEYVEGSNLREMLKIRQRIDQKAALPLIIGLARALKYSLDLGVTHRDIKGTNILISSSGVAKLVDFGLATIEGDEKRMAAAHGQRTVDYSALERTCGSPKGDPRSDIYFLGCVFYQMLTGQLPLPEVETSDPLAKMLKRSFGAIKPLSEQRHSPDEELCVIIEKMMKIDLKARYQTMDDVVHDLELFDAHLKMPVEDAWFLKKKKQQDEHDAESIFATRRVEELEEEDFDEPPKPMKNILCVEAQPEIQEAFRKTLSSMGYRVFLVRDAEVAAERFREDPPHGVIFDADGLGPEALSWLTDMHEKAREDGFELNALVLLGPRQHALKENLPSDDRFIVLGKPIKMKQVQDAIAQLVPLS